MKIRIEKRNMLTKVIAAIAIGVSAYKAGALAKSKVKDLMKKTK
jgi:hypothetical protein